MVGVHLVSLSLAHVSPRGNYEISFHRVMCLEYRDASTEFNGSVNVKFPGFIGLIN